MKYIFFNIVIITAFIFLHVMPETNAIYSDRVTVNGNNYETQIKVDFYARNDNRALGFSVYGIDDFAELKFETTYSHDSINELITGTVPLSGQNSHTEEWLILGSCSSGGTCIYYDTDSADLKVILKDSGGNTKTLTKSISL